MSKRNIDTDEMSLDSVTEKKGFQLQNLSHIEQEEVFRKSFNSDELTKGDISSFGAMLESETDHLRSILVHSNSQTQLHPSKTTQYLEKIQQRLSKLQKLQKENYLRFIFENEERIKENKKLFHRIGDQDIQIKNIHSSQEIIQQRVKKIQMQQNISQKYQQKMKKNLNFLQEKYNLQDQKYNDKIAHLKTISDNSIQNIMKVNEELRFTFDKNADQAISRKQNCKETTIQEVKKLINDVKSQIKKQMIELQQKIKKPEQSYPQNFQLVNSFKGKIEKEESPLKKELLKINKKLMQMEIQRGTLKLMKVKIESLRNEHRILDERIDILTEKQNFSNKLQEYYPEQFQNLEKRLLNMKQTKQWSEALELFKVQPKSLIVIPSNCREQQISIQGNKLEWQESGIAVLFNMGIGRKGVFCFQIHINQNQDPFFQIGITDRIKNADAIPGCLQHSIFLEGDRIIGGDEVIQTRELLTAGTDVRLEVNMDNNTLTFSFQNGEDKMSMEKPRANTISCDKLTQPGTKFVPYIYASGINLTWRLA